MTDLFNHTDKMVGAGEEAATDDHLEWTVGLSPHPDSYHHEIRPWGRFAVVEAQGETYYVPITWRDCPECGGWGDDPWGDDLDDDGNPAACFECDGEGWVPDALQWNDAMTQTEFYERSSQQRWLEKRYGTTDVRQIADYWR